jgi:nitroreductase
MRKRHSVRDYAPDPVPEASDPRLHRHRRQRPFGANRQPWHFVAIADPAMKARIRAAAEEEERAFYNGGAPDEWLAALEPIGTGADKPHLTDAPWLIVVFAEALGRERGRDALQELLRPRKRGHRAWLPDRRDPPCGAGLPGTHAEPDGLPEPDAAPSRRRKSP